MFMPDTSAKRPKTVLYVISKLGVGGAEKNLLLLTANLPRDRYAPVVLSLDGEGEYADRLRQAGVPVYSLRFPSPIYIWRGARFFMRCSFDLFHGFMFHGNLVSRLFGLVFRRPSVSAIRVAEGEKRWHLRLDKWTSRLVDRYTANSQALKDFVREKIGVPDRMISVIPNALSEADAAPPYSRDEARRQLNIPERTGGRPTVLIAMVGRLHVQKDPETFVRAAKRLAEAEEATYFLIAGIGPLQERLEAMIRDFGLAGRFRLAGLVDARDVYAACDIFVLPSNWEGFPNAAIEAMASARPVVLADFPGATEVVDYGATGMIFPRGDEKQLLDALLLLVRDAGLREKMGESAREKARSSFTIEKLVSRNVSIYDELTKD